MQGLSLFSFMRLFYACQTRESNRGAQRIPVRTAVGGCGAATAYVRAANFAIQHSTRRRQLSWVPCPPYNGATVSRICRFPIYDGMGQAGVS